MERVDRQQQPTTYVSKLDVLHSRQINRITAVNLSIWSLSVVYLVVTTTLFNTVFLETKTLTLSNGRHVNIRAVDHIVSIGAFELVLTILCFVFIVALAVVYTQRVIRNKRSPFVQEQVWVIMLLIASSFYMNPVVPLWILHDAYIVKADLQNPEETPDAWFTQKWFVPVLFIAWSLRSFGFNLTSIFFLWATAHTYGLLERPTTKREVMKFYLPKVIPITLYQIARYVCYSPGRMGLSHFPFANMVAMFVHFSTLKEWHYGSVAIIIVLTAFELFFVVAIARQVRATWKRLAVVDYLRYRSKQIGFRFFVAHNLMYYSIMTFYEILNPLLVPRYLQMRFWLSSFRLHFFPSFYGKAYVHLMLLANLAITAFVNLPPDSVGVRGWFHSSDDDEVAQRTIEAEPLRLEPFELPSHFCNQNVQFHANSVVLETHISLLNFAWIVYEWNTKKHGKTNTSRTRLFFKIERHIKNDRTDTNLIIASGCDRIILAFRGTSSSENMRTDLQVVTRPLSEKLPTCAPATHNASDWERARVHKGFIDAYATVSNEVITAVKKFLEEKQRPVLITGHSLGGALATLCSLDLRISLGLPPSQIIVSTFGSPRCGNGSFRALYDTIVPIHWRFAVENDIVTKLPKVGYSHVGKRVLIDVHGNIFLDPNSLKMLLWSGGLASVAYHKKPAYMLGLRAFCRKYLQGCYEPDFCDFAVDETDLRLWEESTNIRLSVRQRKETGVEENSRQWLPGMEDAETITPMIAGGSNSVTL